MVLERRFHKIYRFKLAMEKNNSKGLDGHMPFIDLERASDIVPKNKLWMTVRMLTKNSLKKYKKIDLLSAFRPALSAKFSSLGYRQAVGDFWISINFVWTKLISYFPVSYPG